MVPKLAGVKMLLMVIVPPEKFTIPVGVNVPAGKVCVPPLKVTVPVPFNEEPSECM